MMASKPQIRPDWTLLAYSMLALLLTGVGVVALPMLGLSFSGQFFVTAAAVTIFGVPHGSFDFHEGRLLFEPLIGEHWRFFIISLYVLVSLGVVAGWFSLPLETLVFFLIASAMHFGYWDLSWRTGPRRLAGFLHPIMWLFKGSSFFFLMVMAHGEELQRLFAMLIPPSERAALADFMALAAELQLLWLFGYVGLMGMAMARYRWDSAKGFINGAEHLIEEAAHLCLFLFLPPLLSFSLYFVVWHSTRHSLVIIRHLVPGSPWKGALMYGWRAVLVSGLFVMGIMAMYVADQNIDPLNVLAERQMRSVFYVLSAIAIPHLFLGFVVDPQQSRQEPPKGDEAA